jgi:hypothetical protein
VDYVFSRTEKISGNVQLKDELMKAIYGLEVMPSMRAVMTAGKSADRDNTCVYNCSYLPIDDPKSFDEAMYILLCGTGVGFSVEAKYCQKCQRSYLIVGEYSTSTTLRKDGPSHCVFSSHTSTPGKFPSGTYHQYDPPEPDSKHLVDELPGQNH